MGLRKARQTAASDCLGKCFPVSDFSKPKPSVLGPSAARRFFSAWTRSVTSVGDNCHIRRIAIFVLLVSLLKVYLLHGQGSCPRIWGRSPTPLSLRSCIVYACSDAIVVWICTGLLVPNSYYFTFQPHSRYCHELVLLLGQCQALWCLSEQNDLGLFEISPGI